MFTRLFYVVLAAIILSALSAPVQAEPIAHTGFNTSSGGYVNNGTVVGKGAGEAGWTSLWSTHAPTGTAITQSGYKREGDMALDLHGSGSTGASALREYTDQVGSFYVHADLTRTSRNHTGFSISVFVAFGLAGCYSLKSSRDSKRPFYP